MVICVDATMNGSGARRYRDSDLCKNTLKYVGVSSVGGKRAFAGRSEIFHGATHVASRRSWRIQARFGRFVATKVNSKGTFVALLAGVVQTRSRSVSRSKLEPWHFVVSMGCSSV